MEVVSNKKYNSIVYDIESYPNLFTFVGRWSGTNDYEQFIIWDDSYDYNDLDLLLEFLDQKVPMIGYNNLGYDGQILQHIYNGEIKTAAEIHEFSNYIINEVKDRFKLPYKEWTFTIPQIDLMMINNYGIYGKPTSLKYLEFSMRKKSIKDLPYHFTKVIDKTSMRDDVVKYNYKDVDITHDFYEVCRPMLDMRRELYLEYGDKLIYNMPNHKIGETIILHEYCKFTKKDKKYVKRKHTKRSEIVVKDAILPYVSFEDDILKEVLQGYRNLVLKPDKDGVINIKGAYHKVIEYAGMEVVFGLGGIHGCVSEPGIFSSDDEYILMDFDVGSMYPSVAIANQLYPEHLGIEFSQVYHNILKKRKLYPKGSELNAAFKEAANSVFGKSSSKFNNFLKDQLYLIKTTVNGQLLLTMLTEKLKNLGKFIFNNTDGSMMLIRRDKLDEYYNMCEKWEKLTGVYLEHTECDTIWIKDVNNYILKKADGSTKRKGMFATYDDLEGNYHMNASALIIPQAIYNYFVKGVDPETTVTECDCIHEFLYGIKGGKNFEYAFIKLLIDEESEVSLPKADKIVTLTERCIRYYMSKSGGILIKNWTGGKKSGGKDLIAKGESPKVLMNTSDIQGRIFREYKVGPKGDRQTIVESRYPDLDYTYYTNEAWRWINLIENKDKIS